MDDPSAILDGALSNHYQMIKQFRGVPGVKAEKFEEAKTAKHCALSLVGQTADSLSVISSVVSHSNVLSRGTHHVS